MIVTKGKLITKNYEYILNGVEADRGIILGGNGYCFDKEQKQLLFVETIDDYTEVTVEKTFNDKTDYLIQK